MNLLQQLLAHVRQDEDGEFKGHTLQEHLREVASLAESFAHEFGNGDWARLAGLWHDLGKYSIEFQSYIKTASGYDPEAHLEGNPGKVNHSSAGAIHAVERFGKLGRILAYLIAGHHAGLPDWDETGRGTLFYRLQEDGHWLEKVFSQSPPVNILDQSLPSSRPPQRLSSCALWIRILFSCLVDADFLDTEKFMDVNKAEIRIGYPDLAGLLALFDNYMLKKMSDSEDTHVNRIRADVLRQCRGKSDMPPGIFSLNVPTGGGKTLSSMAFALNHALKHNKRRIIYVIPYTSIIEQVADIFRFIFNSAIVEHHSNIDPEQETQANRLACENWDAPIIVTTNVQFFESLFASRTSRVRKLHNIVSSVVVLDEAQLLPPNLLEPILHAMQNLTDYYGVSFVLSTATQPALNERSGVGWKFSGLKNVHELIDNPDDLHESLKRVDISLPQDFGATQTWGNIAEELQKHPTVLCIVSRRDDCRELYQLMPEGSIHLSALMCGEHRSQVIQKIKEKLAQGEPVRVISTQLVEAGVDMDFPVVYRAMAGLDSIAQAAGRCNREGEYDRGKVVVFVPPKPAPRGLLSKAEQTAIELLKQKDLKDPFAPHGFQEYFKMFYWKVNDLDSEKILDDLKADDLKIQFRTAASKFKLIDESTQGQVIVRFGDSYRLIEMLRKTGPGRWLQRKLQRYVVNVPRSLHEKLKSRGDIEEIHKGIFVQTYPALYHANLGFLGGKEQYHDPNDYVC